MDSDTEMSVTPTVSEDPEDDIFPQNHEMAYHIYNDLWQDFYNWERNYCIDALSSLSLLSPKFPTLPPVSYEPTNYFPTHQQVRYFETEDYNPRTGRVTRFTVAAEPHCFPPWDAYPRYNTCTSASRNVPAIPVNAHLRASFIPFADDETFDYVSHLEDFEDFKWQNDFIDPDLEVIQLETARRLYYTHNFSFSDIDKLALFKFPMRAAANKGLIWYNTQRDALPWPAMHTEAIPRLPENFLEEDANLLEVVMKDMTLFCPRLNCLHTFCEYHGPSHPAILPKATRTNEDMRHDKKDACQNNCYKLVDFDSITLENEDWDEKDHQLFSSVIQLAPDTLPCDLALICRKPCYEMFIERLSTFQDDDILLAKGKESGDKKPPFQFVEETSMEWTMEVQPVGPCYHAGPCNHHCPCYKAKLRCERSCKCSRSCKLRWTGCRCHKHGKVSSTCTDNCRCRKHKRECDPELCKKCDARHGKCSNTRIQRGRFSETYIGKSRYGLGAYAARDIKQGALIGEYVGELLYNHQCNHLTMLQAHVGANYIFDLVKGEPGTVLDSAYLGNETRYLNHSTTRFNCGAEVLHVNGDRRIALIARKDIKAGAELTLNYGDGYWGGNPPPD